MQVIPVSQTIFQPLQSSFLTIVIMVVVTVLDGLDASPTGKTFVVKPELMDQLKLYEAPPNPPNWKALRTG